MSRIESSTQSILYKTSKIYCHHLMRSILRLTGLEEQWDLIRSLEPSGTRENPSNLRDSKKLPGTTGIPRDVISEKDFSGITISYTYLRKYLIGENFVGKK